MLWIMDIWLCRWCWCMTRITPWSSTLRVIIVYPFFYHWSWYNAKDLFFSIVEAAVHTWQDVIQCLLASIHKEPNVLAFEFLMLSNISKLLCEQLLIILRVQFEPDMSLHEVMPPIFCLQTFLVCQSILYLQHQNVFEASKPISACCFWQSMVIESLNKNSVCLSYRFLLNKL